jgi:hypothetical protein
MNLVQGQYMVEFSTVPGYLIEPLPASSPMAVFSGATNSQTFQYYPTITTVDTNSAGSSLTVEFVPSPPAGAGWQILRGGTVLPSGFTTNLFAGSYVISFQPVSGFSTPPNLAVQISFGQPRVLQINYPQSQPIPASFTSLPAQVPPGEVSDETDNPFGFNGQLESDVGYGSGVAVETNVVLTAAHLVFNDQTLSYVSQVYWFAQQETGVTDPFPLQARSWFVLDGYATQRSNDVPVLGPDQSSPQSRNLDVAALYFQSPVGDGGYGGYLPSDASPNQWLTGTAQKMLIGYPVDGSQFGLSDIVAGEMYETGPQPYPLTIASDPTVSDQQVYTAAWFLSCPGNSGGPFYVQFNGYYYPAGVYLGTLFDGTLPYASAVRAIDSNVVNLINTAAALGYTGTNFSGGGVINVIPGADIASNPGLLEVTIAPPAAALDGGAWKLSSLSDAYYSTQNPSTLAVTSTNAEQIQFKEIAGWYSPVGQSLTVAPGIVTKLTNTYSLAVTWVEPAAITYGTSLGANQLDAVTVDPQGNYIYSPPAGVVLNAGTNMLSVVFIPEDTLDYGSANATTNVSLVVVPAPLTVTAGNASRPYGEANPVFAGAIVGLENGDNIMTTYTCDATTNSPPGSYAIVPSLADPNNLETNYTVSLINGTLTITPPIVTILPAPVIQSAAQANGSVTFTWSATPNQMYQIQTTTDLSQGPWTVLATGNTGANSTMTSSEPVGGNGQQFFRVVLLP